MLVGIMALLIAGTPIMFTLLIRGNYDSAYEQMPILFMGMFFSSISSILGGIYIAHKRTRSVGLTTVSAAVIHIIIDLLFVNSIGITAGSVSTLISYLLLVIYRIYDVRKFQKIKFKFKKILLLMIVLFGMCLICEKQDTVLNIFNLIGGIAIALILNKSLIKSFCIKMINIIQR